MSKIYVELKRKKKNRLNTFQIRSKLVTYYNPASLQPIKEKKKLSVYKSHDKICIHVSKKTFFGLYRIIKTNVLQEISSKNILYELQSSKTLYKAQYACRHLKLNPVPRAKDARKKVFLDVKIHV